MVIVPIATSGIFIVSHGSIAAIDGTNSANAIHLKSGMHWQPAALASQFLFQKQNASCGQEKHLLTLSAWPLRRPK